MLHVSKSLSEIERLKLELMKRDIEIEHLKRIHRERSWFKEGTRYIIRQDYKITYELKEKQPITQLLAEVRLNRSGYYKRLKRKNTSY